jgi:hypothetical protein
MTEKQKQTAAKQLGTIVGKLEAWQNRYEPSGPDEEDIDPGCQASHANGCLLRLLNRLEADHAAT